MSRGGSNSSGRTHHATDGSGAGSGGGIVSAPAHIPTPALTHTSSLLNLRGPSGIGSSGSSGNGSGVVHSTPVGTAHSSSSSATTAHSLLSSSSGSSGDSGGGRDEWVARMRAMEVELREMKLERQLRSFPSTPSATRSSTAIPPSSSSREDEKRIGRDRGEVREEKGGGREGKVELVESRTAMQQLSASVLTGPPPPSKRPPLRFSTHVSSPRLPPPASSVSLPITSSSVANDDGDYEGDGLDAALYDGDAIAPIPPTTASTALLPDGRTRLAPSHFDHVYEYGSSVAYSRSLTFTVVARRKEHMTISEALDALYEEGVDPHRSIGIEILVRRLMSIEVIEEGKLGSGTADQLEYTPIAGKRIPRHALAAAMRDARVAATLSGGSGNRGGRGGHRGGRGGRGSRGGRGGGGRGRTGGSTGTSTTGAHKE